MSGAGTAERVRDLVQQDLVDVVVGEPCGQVATHRDPALGEVALPGAGLGVVEGERPRAGAEVCGHELVGAVPGRARARSLVGVAVGRARLSLPGSDPAPEVVGLGAGGVGRTEHPAADRRDLLHRLGDAGRRARPSSARRAATSRAVRRAGRGTVLRAGFGCAIEARMAASTAVRSASVRSDGAPGCRKAWYERRQGGAGLVEAVSLEQRPALDLGRGALELGPLLGRRGVAGQGGLGGGAFVPAEVVQDVRTTDPRGDLVLRAPR